MNSKNIDVNNDICEYLSEQDEKNFDKDISEKIDYKIENNGDNELIS